MDYKEVWCELWDEFVEKNGREPNRVEMRDAWEDYCAGWEDCGV